MKAEIRNRLPEMLGALSHANQYLKIFSVGAVATAVLALVVLRAGFTTPPIVLTLSPSGEALDQVDPPKPEDQIRAAVRHYIAGRYQCDPSNVKTRLGESRAVISPASLKAFDAAIINIARFSTEKLVTQRVYPERMEVSLEKRTILISGDRVTSIQGLRAAGALNLELTFESGPRTLANPWGLYISKEKEAQ